MPQLTPDQMVIAGIGLVLAMFASFHPGVQEKGLAILNWVKNLGTKKTNDPYDFDPDDVISIEGIALNKIDRPEEVHQVVTALAQYFQSQGDIDGVKLTSRIGIHIYEHQLSSMAKEQESNG